MTGSMKNPFLIYGYEDPAHFCDREEETADIISSLLLAKVEYFTDVSYSTDYVN